MTERIVRPKRALPIAPIAEPARRRLPLADVVRPRDLKWQPVYAVWEITLRCDLACHHCGSRAGHARPDELSTAEALDVVTQMADLGVKEVTLIGGEAYLRDDWTEIARGVRAAGMMCSITTGGRGFTPERARAAVLAGVQSVSVSVDGLADTHDALRGVKGSHASAMAALVNLQAAGMRVSSNTQIGRMNLDEIPELFESLVTAGIRSWQVQLTAAMGRAADQPSLILEPHQVLQVMPMLARIKKRADAAKVMIWPGNNIGYFGPFESLLKGTFPRGKLSARHTGTLHADHPGKIARGIGCVEHASGVA